MKYRKDIDGLRAFAVVPVILFHAGFDVFGGGFLGVDIFFVISGYLITTIIINELERQEFSIVSFYERRARRILPALFLVMLFSSVMSYYWMLPDELENFGQSLVATTLFSNNILLTLTSGYWALASEFKPFLHAWSLGVEEQYYIIVPLILMGGFYYLKNNILYLLVAVLVLSFTLCIFLGEINPDASFYLLPTRAWELLVGSIAAVYVNNRGDRNFSFFSSGHLGLLGLFFIIFSIFFFGSKAASPGLYTIVPVSGAVLIILYARENSFSYKILSNKFVVGVGLISYSAYLWHWPIFVFARIYSVVPPSEAVMAALSVLSLVVAYYTWRYVERPFRDRNNFSRKSIFISAFFGSLFFISYGYFLHKEDGLPSRIYSADLSAAADIHIRYNERVFKFKQNEFGQDGKLNLLVAGNSFARDFINAILESYDLSKVNLVYRNDFKQCLKAVSDRREEALFQKADIVVFASGDPDPHCIEEDIRLSEGFGKKIYYVGTKHFGYNLNWVARLQTEDRMSLYNPLRSETLEKEREFLATVPVKNSISILEGLKKQESVQITDEKGRLLSPDRTHLTKYGAQLVGQRVLVSSELGKLIGALQ
ncbi:acyltransferase family protein [Aromatoleum aromaticum]|uniref:acyltransferase family protein n=1 Tax=Aromatoleum aromaticum TaxID=551760 RepID=UPI001459EB40|nr:acyltransferase [Aromatoleum aromaticum]NMG55444.1 acyltransferase family protein [Aromatoleum aromaticum]